ncbi:hypothetical protein E1A91_A10G239400v1 [Gossypium mustelinum]|uniref:Uncharacterized protein n=2 Tax=Gossypium TaxID=3633 RepID=A0ABR0NKF3_GOSAR|nr:uncharacterized protein LOC108463099 [Gossypium arboreum]KAK5795370.1 hypothetical protein PVK06_036632 [Gossypium arboreum]TYJ16259.1 hypothetical protein E1A91_A10G239400v1 [Gossypium mustelinum]
MKSLSSVGLGLSIVFCCLFLALIIELYYLLWWKKRLTSTRDIENDYNNPASELFYMFCWKKTALNPQEIRFQDQQQDQDLFFKPFDDGVDDDDDEHDEDGDDDVIGPRRLLFTIIEETKEDLESEEGKSKKGRSLSDVLLNVETPYLTPLASPPFLTPPLTPLEASCYSHHGFNNPLFESTSFADLNTLMKPPSSSPPPKFKFLQEAEEKLRRKMTFMGQVHNNGGDDGHLSPTLKHLKDEEDGSFITIIVDKNKENRV